MNMIIEKKNINFPVATIFTCLLFCAIYSFKLGEALFYDYPSYYIYLIFQDVINYSLKALWFYGFFIIGASVIRVQSYPKIAFIIMLAVSVINKIVKMFILYIEGDGSLLAYINVGSMFIVMVILAYYSNKTLLFNKENIEVDVVRLGIGTLCFILLNILIGLNYHSVFPKSTWQKIDGKVLVGTYKDNFILRECKGGRSYFYLEEPKNQKFEMLDVNTSGVIGLRCMKS